MPDQGWNQRPLHCTADSEPLGEEGSAPDPPASLPHPLFPLGRLSLLSRPAALWQGLCTGPRSLLFHSQLPSLIFLTLGKVFVQKNPSQGLNLSTLIINDYRPFPGQSSDPQHSTLSFPLWYLALKKKQNTIKMNSFLIVSFTASPLFAHHIHCSVLYPSNAQERTVAWRVLGEYLLQEG